MCTKYAVSNFNRFNDIIYKGAPKFETLVTWGVNFSSCEKGLHALYYHTKFGTQFYPFKRYGGATNFKIRSRDPDHVHFRGQFVVQWIVHVIVNVCTKCEVSTFGHSKDIKGGPKISKLVRDQFRNGVKSVGTWLVPIDLSPPYHSSNRNITWSRLPTTCNGFFHGPCATFSQSLWLLLEQFLGNPAN